MFTGKTVVVVAHRLSTIREADHIYVLQNGRVVEEGTHRQLMVRQGWYATLVQAQSDDGLTTAVRLPALPTTRRLNGTCRLGHEGENHA